MKGNIFKVDLQAITCNPYKRHNLTYIYTIILTHRHNRVNIYRRVNLLFIPS